jgi:hypothetical protein
MYENARGTGESHPDEGKEEKLKQELVRVEQQIRRIQDTGGILKVLLTEEQFRKWDEVARDIISELSERMLLLKGDLDRSNAKGQ